MSHLLRLLPRVVLLVALIPVAGAERPWALRPVVVPPVPQVKGPTRSPIDHFLLAQLEPADLSFASPADRQTWIRRLTFDLIGLPPTPAEIDAYVRDQSPDADERLIDRLLSDPRYGERWGRHWLDLARFAESQGFERDKLRENAWPYRDYVIRSFNDDKPYDQFVREQVAGDVLPGAGGDGVIATGFLVAGPYDEAGSGSASAVVRARVREEELEDLVGTVGQTFLGMTVHCARCHDHKFDPIPQRDYYRLKSIFEGVRHGERLISPEEEKRRDELRTRLNREIARRDQERVELEALGRERCAKKSSPLAAGLPTPIRRWTFDDEAGGELRGAARIAGGRLILDGKTAYLQSETIPTDLRDKTLEAWVVLTNLDQRGGGVISIETPGGGFDSIVFGERQPRKWIAGSDFFRRTSDLNAADESVRPNELVHVAISYRRDGQIAVYRNGLPYGKPYKVIPSKFFAGKSRVLLGLRHTGAGNGFLQAEIEEARLYDQALSDEQVQLSYQAGIAAVTQAEAIAALDSSQRRRWQELGQELVALRQQRDRIPPPAKVYAANIRPPASTVVLLRGDVEKRGEVVSAGGLSAISVPEPEFHLKPEAPEAERRRRFAAWLTDPANPLTARVMVNRIWQHHFGSGLVKTPNDFGANGAVPSHPELLDWLADRFIRSGWSIKAMHRLILNSVAYRQSSQFDARASQVDQEARLLWRYPPRRLEAEVVRDAMLAVSGQLNPKMGGPSFRPFTVTEFNSTFYNLIDDGRPEFNRRTVYRMNVNSAKDPLLETFDCPEPSVKTPSRSVTTTPLQALALMNNSFVQRQAKAMAERVTHAAGNQPSEQVELAYRLTFGRRPSPMERQRAADHVRDHGLANLCWVLLNSSEFLYVK